MVVHLSLNCEKIYTSLWAVYMTIIITKYHFLKKTFTYVNGFILMVKLLFVKTRKILFYVITRKGEMLRRL